MAKYVNTYTLQEGLGSVDVSLNSYYCSEIRLAGNFGIYISPKESQIAKMLLRGRQSP